MNILICGATGFVGSHLLAGLRADGHHCLRGIRRPVSEDDRSVDYLRDLAPADWLSKLEDVDVVINAVGVLRDSRARPMASILSAAPRALFDACVQAGVRRVVNVSALGVESALDVPYFRYRREAEAALFALPEQIRWLNLRPSAIFGEGGASTRLFLVQAALPLHALPMGGHARLQPVHVNDIVEAVRRWMADDDATSLSVNAAGAEEASMREMLDSYRSQLGKREAWHLPVPGAFVRLGARLGDLLPFSPLCRDTLRMLELGNTGDNSAFAALLGRAPKSYREFLLAEEATRRR